MEHTRSAVIRSAFLLAVKVGAFTLTGSAVLLAAMVDSMVDVVASIIAHVVRPKEHHEQHQLALIQASWIVMGALLVMVESLRDFDRPVEMATAGVAILVLTLLVDATIVRKLSHDSNPVVVGLAEDIKADMTNSVGGLVALALIMFGFPMMVDKLVAIIISVFLLIKGLKLFNENMLATSEDHLASHKPGEGGIPISHDNVR